MRQDAHEQRQLDLQRMLVEVSVVVRGERRPELGDRGGQRTADLNLAQGGLPRTAGPDAHSCRQRLVVRARQHDRGRVYLAGESPGQGRDRARIDEPGVRHHQAGHAVRSQSGGPGGERRGLQKCRYETIQLSALPRIEAAGDGRRTRRRVHASASDDTADTGSPRPIPASTRPQRAQAPPLRAAVRRAEKPRRRIRISPQPAHSVSSSSPARLPE